MLTPHGGGYYTIHPALPWFFRRCSSNIIPNEVQLATRRHYQSSTDHHHWRATRAFVESIGELGNYYHDQYEDGNRDVIAPLRSEEANLLHARALARQHGWWDRAHRHHAGTSTLYSHTGRRAEWQRLVEEIVPDFVGADDLPLSGREEQWGISYTIAGVPGKRSPQLAAAEHLQRIQC